MTPTTALRSLGTPKTDKRLTDSWSKRLVVTYLSVEGEDLSPPDVYLVSEENEMKKFPRIIHMYGLLRACFRPRRFEPQIHLSAARLSPEKLGCSRAPSMGSAFSRSSSVFLSPPTVLLAFPPSYFQTAVIREEQFVPILSSRFFATAAVNTRSYWKRISAVQIWLDSVCVTDWLLLLLAKQESAGRQVQFLSS